MNEKSKGHRGFILGYEYYVHHFNGHLYRAPIANPVMPDGYRAGRWEGPPHMVDLLIRSAQHEEKRLAGL